MRKRDNKRSWKRGGYDFKFGPTFSFRCDINVRWRFVIFTRGTRFLTKATYYRIAHSVTIQNFHKLHFINKLRLIIFEPNRVILNCTIKLECRGLITNWQH